ncbi:MAG: hypothetical protein Q8891_09090 [Bacteroidota bacterium]|nr:hypothetical protein [Bacteroidota bacterium]
MTACLSLTFLPLASIAGSPEPAGLVNTTTPASANTNALVLRLNEIKNMDKTNMSSSEKKALRKELHTMKREVKKSNGGVYLSVGAIIIIILLLILLL